MGGTYPYIRVRNFSTPKVQGRQVRVVAHPHSRATYWPSGPGAGPAPTHTTSVAATQYVTSYSTYVSSTSTPPSFHLSMCLLLTNSSNAAVNMGTM